MWAQGSWPLDWIRKWVDYNNASSSSSNASKAEGDDGVGAEREEDEEAAAGASTVATVSAIYIYPVKSCGRISLSRSHVEHTGLKWDRQWMVVKDTGRLLTQRTAPKMVHIEASLPKEILDGTNEKLVKDAFLTLKAPGMADLKIPLALSRNFAIMEPVHIWGWAGPAMDEGSYAAEWMSGYLGQPCRLVRFDTANVSRATDPRYAVGHETAFADVFPMQLISQASVDEVNNFASEPINVDRYRPNIVVEGVEAFAEDYWRTFKVGNLKFHGVALCPRCKQTTIDQRTGEMGPEPLAALRTFRAGRFLTSEPKVKNMLYFGQYVVCDPPTKDIKAEIMVGGKIKLEEHSPPSFFYMQSA